jgi:hypothetical protein
MSSHEEPMHRQRPPQWYLDSDPYAQRIKFMRDEVDAAPPRADGPPYLPIDHALETIRNFESSASSWTRDHLTRLQVVVLENQRGQQLFPADWVVRDDDKAVMKMLTDGFFAPSKAEVSKGVWDTTKPFNNFFMHLLHIQRASRTPSPRISPKPRTARLRHAKRPDWTKGYEDALLSTPASDASYLPSGSPMSDICSIVDLGTRKTSSYMLMHDFLAYLASVEKQVWPDSDQWHPS